MLGKFISKCTYKCLPFFQLLRRNKEYDSNKECKNASQSIKEYLGKAPLSIIPMPNEILYLYLSTAKKTVRFMLVAEKEGGQQPIYYINHPLTQSQQNYPVFDKLAFILKILARKFRHYFGCHTIIVFTSHSFKNGSQKLDASGRMGHISFELREFDIHFKPYPVIKG